MYVGVYTCTRVTYVHRNFCTVFHNSRELTDFLIFAAGTQSFARFVSSALLSTPRNSQMHGKNKFCPSLALLVCRNSFVLFSIFIVTSATKHNRALSNRGSLRPLILFPLILVLESTERRLRVHIRASSRVERKRNITGR